LTYSASPSSSPRSSSIGNAPGRLRVRTSADSPTALLDGRGTHLANQSQFPALAGEPPRGAAAANPPIAIKVPPPKFGVKPTRSGALGGFETLAAQGKQCRVPAAGNSRLPNCPTQRSHSGLPAAAGPPLRIRPRRARRRLRDLRTRRPRPARPRQPVRDREPGPHRVAGHRGPRGERDRTWTRVGRTWALIRLSSLSRREFACDRHATRLLWSGQDNGGGPSIPLDSI
jgi:hypothetical protein